MMRVELTVNGQRRSDDVEPRLLLAHYLRETCGLRAANIGCDTTSCGACTVIFNGSSVKSCTMLTVQAAGGEVTTAEGLAAPDGELHPVQRAFRQEHGLQCGFCTPGMVMAAVGLLAGGHSLLPMMKLRLVAPTALIDIGRVSELAGIRADGDELVIGAMTRHADLAAAELVRSGAPLLAHAAAQVGDPQIRHRGTIGGSLAHADPAADLPMALLALGGTIEAQGPGGTRRIAADDFFTGFFETSLAPDELLTAVRVPRRPDAAWGYQKFVRRANDWAIVGVAATGGRIALANMGPVPLRASAAEQALAGGAGIAEAAELAADGTEPGEDIHADGEFRRHLARVLTRRALEHRT